MAATATKRVGPSSGGATAASPRLSGWAESAARNTRRGFADFKRDGAVYGSGGRYTPTALSVSGSRAPSGCIRVGSSSTVSRRAWPTAWRWALASRRRPASSVCRRSSRHCRRVSITLGWESAAGSCRTADRSASGHRASGMRSAQRLGRSSPSVAIGGRAYQVRVRKKCECRLRIEARSPRRCRSVATSSIPSPQRFMRMRPERSILSSGARSAATSRIARLAGFRWCRSKAR